MEGSAVAAHQVEGGKRPWCRGYYVGGAHVPREMTDGIIKGKFYTGV